MEKGRNYYRKEIDVGRVVGAAVLQFRENNGAPELVALNIGGASTPGAESLEDSKTFLQLGQTVRIPHGYTLHVTK